MSVSYLNKCPRVRHDGHLWRYALVQQLLSEWNDATLTDGKYAEILKACPVPPSEERCDKCIISSARKICLIYNKILWTSHFEVVLCDISVKMGWFYLFVVFQPSKNHQLSSVPTANSISIKTKQIGIKSQPQVLSVLSVRGCGGTLCSGEILYSI